MTQSFVRVDHLKEVNHREPTYLAIGSFDGVHLGHQEILRRLVTTARQDGVRSAVLTFFPHPKRTIQQLSGRYYITTLEERVALLGAMGIDLVIMHPFDDTVRHIRAAAFIEQLQAALDMRQLWGGNFALGYQREGTVPFLRRLGAEHGFSVRTVDTLVNWQDEPVSSSRIRAALENGRIAEVNGCLGRPYAVTGIVAQGDQRGRTIGFPTANLAVWDELLLPANGVYATLAQLGDQHFIAATNVGVRPTVNGRDRTIEAHLLDFSGDLYGQELRLTFMHHIRPEMKFSGVDVLKAQIASDVATIRALLSD